MVYMAGIYQEVHPYQPNVTKSCAKQAFSWGHFFKELRESFCVLSLKGSVPRICKNIFKKVSKKNRNFWLKISYNSGRNIKYTWLLKVLYIEPSNKFVFKQHFTQFVSETTFQGPQVPPLTFNIYSKLPSRRDECCAALFYSCFCFKEDIL